jgi:hypothetical protein
MRKTLIIAAAASAALAASAAALPAEASGTNADKNLVAYPVVANGLHNPRQIAFGANGAMYVAEAGSGGDGTCIPGGEGPTCYGTTGSVMRVLHGKQYRVLKGLASLGGEGTGAQAIGPADLAVVGKNKLVVSFGLGSQPKNRKKLPKLGKQQLGHLIQFHLRNKKFSSLGDISLHEARTNPIDNPDSDPTGIVQVNKNTWLVTDSGGNTLVRAHNGHVKTLAAFKDRMVTSPLTGPNPVPTQSVPTDVVRGADGAYYVSELTGFPFIQGSARIWRIVPGHKAHVWATGLTNVTSMAVQGKKLYAVQISDAGLASGGPPMGSLIRVFPKSSGKAAVPISSPLFAPYGVAIRGHNAYVSIGSVAPRGGQVVRIPLG